MPNIIGEGFRKYVVDQIRRRELQYGAANKSSENIAYQNGKTGWVAMASGVDVETINFFNGSSYQGQNVGGNNLAKQYVLFNGTYKEQAGKDRSNQKGGISLSEQVFPNNAYGMGGNLASYGLRPMAGITSVSITSGPRGSLRFADVKIKAWNRAQFEAIDALYMRLGFTVLLEFGHSNFFYNGGTYEENNPYTFIDSFLDGTNKVANVPGVAVGKKLGQYDVLSAIRHLREMSNGNYDAVYAKVCNFNWSFQKDGSFDISVKLVSMGDVIEALKVNVMTTPKTLASDTTTQQGEEGTVVEEPTSAQIIESYADKHDIGRMLNQVRVNLDSEGSGDGAAFIRYKAYGVSKDSTGRNLIDAFKQTPNGSNDKYYLRLGSFLQWYEIAKMVAVKDDKPLLSLDYDTDTNLVFFAEGQRSTDPTICVLSLEYPLTDGTKRVYAPGMEKYAEDVKQGYGKIMNVYLNFEFILTTIDSVKDDEGNVVLIDFLEKILSGICEATGNINKLSVAIDEEENIIRIIDEVKLPNRDELLAKITKNASPTLALFTMYGFRTEGTERGATRGSFIKDFSVQTSFSKETAAMITIGAQADGRVVGEDATAFSAWSKGLIDRIEPSKIDKAVSKEPESFDKTFADDLVKYNQFLQDISSGTGVTAPTYNVDDIAAWSSFQKTYLQYKIGENAKNKNVASNTIGFLPINLSLTMEGLSGMKVYQKFAVDSAFLPANYPTALEFIVKSIAHTIDSNGWITTIESLVVPNSIPKTGEMGYLREVPGTDQPRTSTTGGTGSGAVPATWTNGLPCGAVKKEQKDMRVVINQVIKYLEGGYYNPSLHGGAKVKDTRYDASGETMFGIDRKAGGVNNDEKKRFWKRLDEIRKGEPWPHYSYPKNQKDRDELERLAGDIILKAFRASQAREREKGSKLLADLIESDGRLIFHFVYAQYNGPGYASGFRQIARQAIKNGATTSDQVLEGQLQERRSGGYNAYTLGCSGWRYTKKGKKYYYTAHLGPKYASLIAQGGAKIDKLVGYRCQPITGDITTTSSPSTPAPGNTTNTNTAPPKPGTTRVVPKTGQNETAGQVVVKLTKWLDNAVIETKPGAQLIMTVTDKKTFDGEDEKDWRANKVIKSFKGVFPLQVDTTPGSDSIYTEQQYIGSIRAIGDDYVQFPWDVEGYSGPAVVKIKVTDIKAVFED